MKKKLTVTVLAAAMTMAMGLTAFARTGWIQEPDGRWWYSLTEDESEYYFADDGATAGWELIDGNKDGIAEVYVFDPSGWLYTDTVIDGHSINSDGQMLDENGDVIKVQSEYQPTGPNGSYSGDVNDQYQWIDTDYWSEPEGEGDHLILGISVDDAFAAFYTPESSGNEVNDTMNKVSDGSYKGSGKSWTMTLNSDGTITFNNRTFYPY